MSRQLTLWRVVQLGSGKRIYAPAVVNDSERQLTVVDEKNERDLLLNVKRTVRATRLISLGINAR